MGRIVISLPSNIDIAIHEAFREITTRLVSSIAGTNLSEDTDGTLKVDDPLAIGEINLSSTIDKITHSSTTKRMTVGSCGVIPATTNPVDVQGSAVTPSSADSAYDYGYVPIILPIGATVTKITLYGYTNDTVNDEVTVTLYRVPFNSGTTSSMASVTISNGQVTNFDSSISDPVIDYLYRYYIELKIKADGSTTDSIFYSVITEYTVSNVKQVI